MYQAGEVARSSEGRDVCGLYPLGSKLLELVNSAWLTKQWVPTEDDSKIQQIEYSISTPPAHPTRPQQQDDLPAPSCCTREAGLWAPAILKMGKYIIMYADVEKAVNTSWKGYLMLTGQCIVCDQDVDTICSCNLQVYIFVSLLIWVTMPVVTQISSLVIHEI
jgi:hypothetical protein